MSLLALLCAALAGVQVAVPAEPAPEEKKEEPPKIPPFKYSAWCAFRNLRSVQQAEEMLKKNPPQKPEESEHARPASAQWTGYARRGHWISLVVEIQNTTEKRVYRGNLNVRLAGSGEESGGGPYATRYRQAQDFELAPQSTQRLQFSVLCPEADFQQQVLIGIETNWGSFERAVFLTDLERSRSDLIVVVADDAGAFSGLVDPGERDAAGADRSGRAVANVRPEDLPRRWYDLALANLILIHGPPRDGVSDEQLQALEGYCQAGGHVLLCANGKDPGLLRQREGQTRSLAQLAGLKEVRDAVKLNRLELFTELFPVSKLPDDWELSVLDVVAAEPGMVAVRNKSAAIPELVRRSLGLGSVTFLPFSPLDGKLANWRGQLGLPLSILKQERRPVMFAPSPPPEDAAGEPAEAHARSGPGLAALRTALDDSFAEDTPVETPPKGMVLSFLLLYLLAAVPVNYFIFGWFKRREVAWLAVPVEAVVFSILAYWWGYYGQLGKLSVNEVCVVEAGPQQEHAVARTFLALYSPRRGGFRVDFAGRGGSAEDTAAAPEHLVNTEFKTRGLSDLPDLRVLDDGRLLAVEDFQVKARATRRLEVAHRAVLGGRLEVSLTRNPERKTCEIRLANGTQYQLYRPALLCPGPSQALRGMPLGEFISSRAEPLVLRDLPNPDSDAAPAKWLSLKDAFFGKDVTFQFARGPDSKKRREALENYVSDRLALYRAPVLVAWIDGGVLPVTVSDGAEVLPHGSRGFCLLLVPLPYEARRGAPDLSGAWGLCSSLEYDLDPRNAAWRTCTETSRIPLGRRSPSQGLLNLRLTPPPYATGQPPHILLDFSLRLCPAAELRDGSVPLSAAGRVQVLVEEHPAGGAVRSTALDVQPVTCALQPGVSTLYTVRGFTLKPEYLDNERTVKIRVDLLNADFRFAKVAPDTGDEWPLAVERLRVRFANQ